MSLPARLRKLLKGELSRATGASFLLRIGNLVLTWGISILLARLLGVAAFGQYSFVLAFVTTLAIPAQFGLPALLIREVGRARAAGEPGRAIGLKRWAYRVTLSISLPVIALLMLAALIRPDLFAQGEVPIILWGAPLVALLPLSSIRSGIIRGLDRVVLGQLAWQIVRPAAQVVLLLALLLLPLGGLALDASGAMASNVIATLISWLFGAVVLARLIGRAPAGPGRARAAVPGWRSSMIALGLANGMYLLDGQIGILLLGLVASDAEVGLYKVASQGAMFTAMGYAAANASLGPKVARAWAEGRRDAVQHAVVEGARLSVLYAAPIACVLIVGGGLLLGLVFGAEYAPAWPALALLVAAQLVNAAFGSATALLNMTHQERANTRAFAIALGFNIAATAIVAPLWGATGAALASALSIVLRNLMLWRSARRLLGIETGFWGARGRVAQPATSARAAAATSSE